MVVRRLLAAAAATGLALGLAACGGDSDPVGAPSTGGNATTSSTPTTTPSVPQPSATPSSATPPSTVQPKARTKAALTEALLVPAELPKGMTIDKSPEQDGGMTLTGRGCADFEKLFRSDAAPGAKVSVVRSYTGGENGPSMDEGLDVLASPAEATALVTRVAKAVSSCPKATWKLEGVGSSSVTIKKIEVPRTAGGSHTGFVLTATDGEMQGFEMHCAFVALGDVILSLNTDRADLLAPTTTKAVKKASMKLGVGR